MSRNSEEIAVLLEEYSRINRGESRLKAIHHELVSQRERSAQLKERVDKEYQDVVTLETSSMKYIFSSILRNRKEQLEKERQEYLLATIEYNECRYLIEALEYEKGILKNKSTNKELVIKELDRKLTDLLEVSPDTTSSLQEEFTIVNKDIKNLNRLMMETKEAQAVAVDLESHFHSMIAFMNKASSYDNWGEFYDEVQQGKKLKKENIDKAQGEVYIIKTLLFFLKDALSDVEQMHDEFKRSEVIIRNFNIKYYRHLITDWIEASDLEHALTSTMAASKVIHNLDSSIMGLRKSIKEELTFALSKREKLLQRMVDQID